MKTMVEAMRQEEQKNELKMSLKWLKKSLNS